MRKEGAGKAAWKTNEFSKLCVYRRFKKITRVGSRAADVVMFAGLTP